MILIEFTTDTGQTLIADVIAKRIQSANPDWDWTEYGELQEGRPGSDLTVRWEDDDKTQTKCAIDRIQFLKMDD